MATEYGLPKVDDKGNILPIKLNKITNNEELQASSQHKDEPGRYEPIDPIGTVSLIKY